MKMQPFNDAERAAIVGCSGSGKSFAAKKAVARELERGRNVTAFEPHDEWSLLGRPNKHVNLGPLKQRVEWDEFVLNARGYLCAVPLSLAVICSDDSEEAAQQCAEFVGFVKSVGDILPVFEETGLYAGPDCESNDGKRALNKIATNGRHWGCPVLFVSQRAVHVPTSARAQLTQLETFLQTMPADLGALFELTRRKEFGGCSKPSDEACEFSPVCVAHQAARESKLWCSTLNKEAKK